MTVSNEQLKEWRALAEAATPGEWTHYEPHGTILGNAPGSGGPLEVAVLGGENMCNVADGSFIAASRTVLLALLDEVERLKSDVETHRFDAANWAEDHARITAERDRLRSLLSVAMDHWQSWAREYGRASEAEQADWQRCHDAVKEGQ